MFLEPDGDEIAIAAAAAEYLAHLLPISRLHAAGSADLSQEHRVALADSGWFALALSEAKGGSGLSSVEHALFFRELGRQCGPVDVLAQSLAVLVAVDDEMLRNALASGEQGVALAVADGARLRVLGAPEADMLLILNRDVARLLPSTLGSERPALDPANSMRLVEAELAPLAERADGDVWRMAELGAAAMLIGIAEAALDLIVDYAKVRETFGRKIGSYQAVRHPCADMALRLEAARCQLWYAAAAIKEKRGDADVHLDAAKHLANQAALANADSNIQLHGGIGVTEEHDAHLLLKHALLLSKLFGSKRPLLSRLLASRTED